MPDKTRLSLALILLFLAPSAWGQAGLGVGRNCYTGYLTADATCSDDREIPDPIKTPGVIAEDGHDIRNVCGVVDGLSYSKRHRATPEGLKAMIRKRDHAVGVGEVDHRVPISLGGADVAYDLWWQPGPDSGARWVFTDKDRLETLMWHRVCGEGSYGLAQAQAVFLAPDWRVAYCAEFRDERCAVK